MAVAKKMNSDGRAATHLLPVPDLLLVQMLVSPMERVIYEAAFALENISMIEEGAT